MKRIILIFIFILYFVTIHSQNIKQRYILWYIPSNVERIHGIALNPWLTESNFSKELIINGFHIQINPFFTLMVPVAVLGSISFISNNDFADKTHYENHNTINGINFTIFDFGISKVNGLDLNIIGSDVGIVNGISLGGLLNKPYFIKGIAIASISNKSFECHGLQISLINYCKKLKGFQIGLWNINKKRSLPFLNWCFSDDKY